MWNSGGLCKREKGKIGLPEGRVDNYGGDKAPEVKRKRREEG